ncbi:MAG: hypothetical protein AUK47_23800 [Deltaproteobacteria bacterium CG2_30_63_29]|nr:MAG: hypothetical protein AUK47_23800 [Deltaproteobacteria bacterium CG2_30_63_29]PJB47889.1 MAG: hypothetical protein CO108_03335 [Deltaproteobacteria bacterium CG_4_9_14_3_um_filter_63_12]
MDSAYFGQMLLSIAIFAPGLILLAVFGFIGVALLLEKAGVLGAKNEEPVEGANPAAAEVVANLNEAVEAEAEVKKNGKKTAKKKRTGTRG